MTETPTAASDRHATSGSEATSARLRVPLCELRAGDRARLEALDLDRSEAEVVRSMGLHESCDLRICRSAGTCIVQVLGEDGSGGCRIALDRRIARDVQVVPITSAGRSVG